MRDYVDDLLGASYVIEYRVEDFTQPSQQYDFVLDGVGKKQLL